MAKHFLVGWAAGLSMALYDEVLLFEDYRHRSESSSLCCIVILPNHCDGIYLRPLLASVLATSQEKLAWPVGHL